MAQWLEALTTLGEQEPLFSSAICDSRSWGSDALCWPLLPCHVHHISILTCSGIHVVMKITKDTLNYRVEGCKIEELVRAQWLRALAALQRL